MRLAIVADTFPPLRTSGAVQLRDLSREFVAQGHQVYVLVAAPNLARPFQLEELAGVTVVRLRTPPIKDIGYLRRAINEFLAPFAMRRNLNKSPLRDMRFDAVIWYSPTIFLGPLARWLKRRSGCSSYLIIRDIFPQWAADMGLISRGPGYRLLNRVAQFQYSVADVIGVQTAGNLDFLCGPEAGMHGARLEVLPNWLGAAGQLPCPIDLGQGPLAGRKVFVYAGNMGVAQGMDKIVNLARALRDRNDIGFLLVGRGHDADRIAAQVAAEGLGNVQVHDEIDPDEIPALYRQCKAGLVCLDPRHTTHNIPGKFLSYMQSGLPVLASINPGNDLVDLMASHRVGLTSVCRSGSDLAELALALLEQIEQDPAISARCNALFDGMFSASAAVRQVVAALEGL